MYKLLIPLAAGLLTACGGGSTSDPNNFIISTPTGTPLTATQAKTFSQTGSGAYSLSAGSSSMTLTRTNQQAAHLATYDLVVNGVTYQLTPASGNSATSSNNSFVGSNGSTSVSLFLNENTANASIANAQLTTGSTKDELFGIVGNATPAGTLASISSATYSGVGEISIDKANGQFDDAPSSTATMNVDFSGGTLIGSFSVSDPAGENGGAFDIAGSTTLPMTGTVSGNTFTGTVDYTNLVGITNGLTSVTAQPVEGGFFGPNAENAVGVGLSLGQSSVANDVIVYTRIQANKQ